MRKPNDPVDDLNEASLALVERLESGLDQRSLAELERTYEKLVGLFLAAVRESADEDQRSRLKDIHDSHAQRWLTSYREEARSTGLFIPRQLPASEGAPVVSVIIPCYGHGRWLRDAVQSVASQDYPSWEVLVVIDGSPDDAVTIALELQRELGPRVRVLDKRNEGLSAARNWGFRAARGKYFLPLDADDCLAPDFLSSCVALFEARSDVDIVYPLLQHFGTEGGIWVTGPVALPQALKMNGTPNCAMFRREVFEEVGGYWHFPDLYEDWEFWLAALGKGRRAVRCPLALLLVRRHGESMQSEKAGRRSLLIERMKVLHPSLYGKDAEADARASLGLPPVAVDDVQAFGRGTCSVTVIDPDDRDDQRLLKRIAAEFTAGSGFSFLLVVHSERAAHAVAEILHGGDHNALDLPDILILTIEEPDPNLARELLLSAPVILDTGRPDLDFLKTQARDCMIRSISTLDELRTFAPRELSSTDR
ncbi:MAG: glycosyltransferase family A protein [Candidatus Sericytochromatia bacterium]|nr:glycosyltransferase family A protein [Candidatus Sericytochromatia bacterium]